MVIESLHIASKMGKMLALVLDRKFVDQTESEENNITFPRRCIVSFTGERDFAPEDGLVIRVEDIRKNYQVTDKYEILEYMMRIIANNKA